MVGTTKILFCHNSRPHSGHGTNFLSAVLLCAALPNVPSKKAAQSPVKNGNPNRCKEVHGKATDGTYHRTAGKLAQTKPPALGKAGQNSAQLR